MATSRESQVPELFELFAPLAQSDPYQLYHMLLDQGPAMKTPIGVLVVGFGRSLARA